jgi:hypothetical protein
MQKNKLSNYLLPCAALFAIFQVLNIFYFIDRYSVDVPFWDQWNFYSAFFQQHSLWEIFTWQHGPHRQGLGFFLIWAINELTGWNQRAQCFMIGGVMVLAAITFLWLKSRVFGKVCWYDLIPVLMILSMRQWEIYANAPNVSHAALPLLLILLLCVSWTIGHYIVRYALIAGINVFVTFTGFGMFIGIITPLLLGIECWHTLKNHNKKQLLAILCTIGFSLITIALFYNNYLMQPAADCFRFPDPKWYLYPVFMAIEYTSIVLPGHAGSFSGIVIGSFALLMILAMLGVAGFQLIISGDRRKSNVIVILLLAFSLIFSLSAAVGRLCVGFSAATASRYLPLLTTAPIGVYIFLMNFPRWTERTVVMAILLCLVTITIVPLWAKDMATELRRGKSVWVAAYTSTENVARADSIARFKIHPDPAQINLDRKLEWLRVHHYSLFRNKTNNGND